MNNLGEKLKQIRKKKNISQKKLAKKLNLTQGALSKYEKNITTPNPYTLSEIAKALDVSVDYLVGVSDNSAEKGIKIPVLGTIPAGIPIEAIEEILDYEEIPKEWTSQGEYFGLKVRGDSMEPRICSGDVVIVRKQEDANSGDICIVMVNGFDATLKKIKKEPNGLWLVPFNQVYSPVFYTNEQIESLPLRIIGKVVELRGKF